jgi:hypothetical protein
MAKPGETTWDFKGGLADIASADIIPKMRQAAFCLIALDAQDPDPFLALQVGLALLLEKPLIILATEGTWVPDRLRKLADAVVTGSRNDVATNTALRAAMEQLMDRLELQRQ